MTYKFEVEKILSPEELQGIAAQCQPLLKKLHRRYALDLEVVDGYMPRAEYLDVLRTSWFLDPRKSKLSRRKATMALGYAYGKLLCDLVGMKWCITSDNWGEVVSVVFERSNGPEDLPRYVSTAPFGYVAKRETVANAEVFVDGFRSIKETIAGTPN